ncbi:histidinol-phosphate transaminase [Aureivirga sp. CE67]|uniref:histidinol-phosphate transaminase n=1 Tax=Aureivirga sp. CE67 TaxID=1788983 RepID=UPI0018CA7934|nr:histidinol-phosphate transaminase [Aureivirga sp. CE67]
MERIEKLINPHILSLQAYSSARSESNLKEGIFLDANENPFGNFNRYPDGNQNELKNILSKQLNISKSNLFLGNGSDEAIDLLIRIFCNQKEDKIGIFSPTYGMYQVSAAINNVDIEEYYLNENFEILEETLKEIISNKNLKILFICSPNNPTGNCIKESKIDFLLENFKGIVVVDEAYIDFSSKDSFVKKVEKFQNLVVLQTLSKSWGMAGLRIGLAVSNPLIISFLNKIKPPYNISLESQKKAIEILKNKKVFEKNINKILNQKEELKKELSGLSFVEKIFPSEANFLLIKCKNSEKIYQELIENKIIIRNRNSQIKDCLRISIGTKQENKILIQKLKEIDEKGIVY